MLITILSILMTVGCLFLMIAVSWIGAIIGEAILRKSFDNTWGELFSRFEEGHNE